MSRKKDARRVKRTSEKRPPLVLVFGEDENDRVSIRELIEALRADLVGKVQTRREPLILIKNAKPEDVPERAKRIADAVDISRATHDIVCVFAHEDRDDFEPKHEETCKKIEEALEEAGCPAHAVVPAWELEAWWFMWPEAVQAVRPRSWRAPDDYLGKEVGKLKDAKEELPSMARQVREKGLARQPGAKSASYARFLSSVEQCKLEKR